jgi:activator of HSP90 ATPase
MSNTITLAVDLPATPARLYHMYLNPKLHGAFTGSPVAIAARSGAPFKAFGGALSGTILQVVRNRLIVQAWRSTNFARADIDSTLVLRFLPRGKGARIELTQVNVAERDFGGVTEGWSKYYFVPWRAYLER